MDQRSPPPYNEAIRLHDLCTEPLLQPGISFPSELPSLDAVFYSLPGTVTINLSTDDSNTFYIRDLQNCVIVKGNISPGNIALYNANGGKFLSINNNRVRVDEASNAATRKYVHKSTVLHNTHKLGTVDCPEFDLNRISVANCFNKYDFFTNCMGNTTKDIVISKSRNSPPICQSHIDSGEVSSFHATLVFPTETSITQVEQCLCIAAIITFILARNYVQTEKKSSMQCASIVVCFIICIFVALIGYAFITWLHAEECRRFPYRCKKN